MLEQYGFHRVLDEDPKFPQGSHRLNPVPPYLENELVIQVEHLHLDSASLYSLKQHYNSAEAEITAAIKNVIRERGKMQNPVTGSGGVLSGLVVQSNEKFFPDLKQGDRVISLVSLTLCPLHVDDIISIDLDSGVVAVKGTAILFQKTIYHKIERGTDVQQALKILDVCGAPMQVAHYVTSGQRVGILGGGGKSGILCCVAAKEAGCAVIAIDKAESVLHLLQEKGFADRIMVMDVMQPECYEELQCLENDFTISCVNVPDTEMAAILATKDGGRVLFFNMATSFSKAVLGAEGIAKDVEMIMGNGYKKGHANYALDLVKRHPFLVQLIS